MDEPRIPQLQPWGVSKICSVCEKAINGCSWSRTFTPIMGWQAIKTKIKRVKGATIKSDIESYKILYCPEFLYDGMCYRCKRCPKEHKRNENWANVCQYYYNNMGECGNFLY